MRKRFAHVVLAAAVALLSGCAATSHTYQRTGTAAAVLALTGTVLTPVGNPGIARTNETAGNVVAGVGAALQLSGLLLGLWALDGLMQQSAAR